MTWIVLALAGLAALVWLGRRKGGEWRPAGAVVAAALFVGAAAAGLRNQWLLCAALVAMGAALSVSARRRTLPSEDQARRILGVDPDATDDEIRAAHRRLIRRSHPDAGGDAESAKRLNAARDRLLKR